MVAAVARKRLPQQSSNVSSFETDVLQGLRATPKQVPAKYFYDEIEIKKCKRVQMPQQIQQFHQPDEVDGYDRITDIDAPDDNSSYYVL